MSDAHTSPDTVDRETIISLMIAHYLRKEDPDLRKEMGQLLDIAQRFHGPAQAPTGEWEPKPVAWRIYIPDGSNWQELTASHTVAMRKRREGFVVDPLYVSPVPSTHQPAPSQDGEREG